jgi:hypothetical protein
MKAHCNAGLPAGLLACLLLSPVSSRIASSQAPAPAPAPEQHASSLGFRYSVPGDWEVVDSQSKMPQLKEQADKNAGSDEEKKGLACVQVVLTARHGDPASVMVEVALPFDCFGETMTEAELPGFASGASEGLKQSFDVGAPVTANYSLGSHTMWIERTKGAPKGHPEISYTVEITCGLLKKAAVCWMAMAADDTALHTFERAVVTLDGESSSALVPPTAFDKKPL